MSFPTDVRTVGVCPYCGATVLPARRGNGKSKEFCSARHKSAWWFWRRMLAVERIAAATTALGETLATEFPFLQRKG